MQLMNCKISRCSDDPNLLYTFHFYLPMLVTHQRAPWVKEMDLYGKAVDYPGKAQGFGKISRTTPQIQTKSTQRSLTSKWIKTIFGKPLQPAIDFIQQTGHASLLRRVWRNRPGLYDYPHQLDAGLYRIASRTQDWRGNLVLQRNGFWTGRCE